MMEVGFAFNMSVEAILTHLLSKLKSGEVTITGFTTKSHMGSGEVTIVYERVERVKEKEGV
jgi:hypothetical protein